MNLTDLLLVSALIGIGIGLGIPLGERYGAIGFILGAIGGVVGVFLVLRLALFLVPKRCLDKGKKPSTTEEDED